jgi:hypothetical protein
VIGGFSFFGLGVGVSIAVLAVLVVRLMFIVRALEQRTLELGWYVGFLAGGLPEEERAAIAEKLEDFRRGGPYRGQPVSDPGAKV